MCWQHVARCSTPNNNYSDNLLVTGISTVSKEHVPDLKHDINISDVSLLSIKLSTNTKNKQLGSSYTENDIGASVFLTDKLQSKEKKIIPARTKYAWSKSSMRKNVHLVSNCAVYLRDHFC